MTVWSRPSCAPPGTPFCAVVDVGASIVTACAGRWQPSEGDEIRWSVAEGERCGGCVAGIERQAADVATLRRFRDDLRAGRVQVAPRDVGGDGEGPQ